MKPLMSKLLDFLLFVGPVVLFISCNQSIEDYQDDVELKSNWKIQSSEKINADGATISSPEFDTQGWYDTEVPSTVLSALVGNQVYKDIYKGTNLAGIPREPFLVPWWFRTTFTIGSKDPDVIYRILFEGINYKTNVWLNGKKIADSDTMASTYRRFKFDITSGIADGENTLAVEVIPPGKTDLTLGFVDWNPAPPDKNMGIWRPVHLIKTGSISLENVFVQPGLNVESLDEANLTISADVVNHSDSEISGKINCRIGDIRVSKVVVLKPGSHDKIIFDHTDFPELHIEDPRIWWPNNLGNPDLYTMQISATMKKDTSDRQSIRFGIRDISGFKTDDGYRGFMINGKKILIKGGGWTDDMLLSDSDEKVKDQIEYVKHMNLNTIRLEGFWGRNRKLFDYADEYGILVMLGWSCQWEWKNYSGREEDRYMAIRTPQDIAVQAQGYIDQVHWLRNHPSVFLWVLGSDKVLEPDLERKMNDLLSAEDPTRLVLNSCGTKVSDVSGPSGVKMNGPYAYVTPDYWYEDTENGGAFGFNTETGPGLQPSPLESIKKMIPENHLWPIDSVWEYHLGGGEYKTFEYWLKPFDNRYGRANNVEDFTFKAQMANYEAIRPMFEAFEVNKYKSTGVVQWMLNSAWPGMLWQLYDWYLMPNGAFYGTKTACEPVNIVYNYKDKNIYLTNDLYHPLDSLQAEVRVYTSDSRMVFQAISEVNMEANSSKMIVDMPVLKDLTQTYFLDLKLRNTNDEVIGDNFYWLSTKPDILDFVKTTWFVTPNKSYADLKGIDNLPETSIRVDHTFREEGEKQFVEVRLQNLTTRLAFFIQLNVHGKSSGKSVLPVFWEDNYVSLVPGGSKNITGWFYKKDLNGEEPEFSYKGWNVSGGSEQ